ncbi:MAG TPA: hypothetical protein VGO04_14495 [Ensifer sp.]|jgi:hypothetical protein|uniref:hypothetical protein n=1 Tax=Ensifer sp. TaxID=1872086 RepID=UPI002E0E9E6B|nr:hypothetical protein [Ensifer sp.]
MPIETLNPEVWKLVGTLNGQWKSNGGKDFGWGTVKTSSQTLTANALLSVYKLMRGNQNLTRDYYLVAGDVYHGVQGSPSNPSSNWVSVGFYANHMKLNLEATSTQARLMTFGPNSTVEQATISFSIGGELSAEYSKEGPKGGASLSANVGVSFTASEVSFAARPATQSIEWQARLPHVGWVSPGVPANPGRPSYAGYIWNAAAIIEVPQGVVPNLKGRFEVDFEYNWTRGIRKRSFTPGIELVYQSLVTTGADDALLEQPLPTILETLRSLAATTGREGKTDTFLMALEGSRVINAFGDSNLDQIVIAPTNQAIQQYFDKHPQTALEAVSPANQIWLDTWVAERVISTPPGSVNLGAISASVRTIAGLQGEWFECADGLLLVTDTYEVASGLRSALQKGAVKAA